MPPSGPRLAPAGQAYLLPANSLIGEISFRPSDKRKITEHKRSMGIVVGLQGDAIYSAGRDAVKDQMLAKGYQTDLDHFPDAEFLQIVAGFRQLRPACDEFTIASAANNLPGMQQVDKGVVQMVKDYGKKVTNTIYLKNKMFPQVLGVPREQVIVPNILLPENAPPLGQWGLAIAVQNAGAGAPNAPTANAPGPAQFLPSQAAGLYQIPPPPLNPQGANQPPSTASAHAGPSGNQIQPLPPNPQVANEPPSTASANAGPSGNQMQAPPLNPQGPNQPPSTASANSGVTTLR